MRGRAVVALGALGALLLGALALAEPSTPAALRPVIAAEYPDVAWITTAELARALARPGGLRPALFDARTSAEFDVSHLRDATRIDPDHPDLARLRGAAGRSIVIYCSVGYRSARVADLARRAGIAGVRNLEGGIFAWANEGRPVVRGDREVHDVHPFDPTWGRLLRADYRTTRPR